MKEKKKGKNMGIGVSILFVVIIILVIVSGIIARNILNDEFNNKEAENIVTNE